MLSATCRPIATNTLLVCRRPAIIPSDTPLRMRGRVDVISESLSKNYVPSCGTSVWGLSSRAYFALAKFPDHARVHGGDFVQYCRWTSSGSQICGAIAAQTRHKNSDRDTSYSGHTAAAFKHIRSAKGGMSKGISYNRLENHHVLSLAFNNFALDRWINNISIQKRCFSERGSDSPVSNDRLPMTSLSDLDETCSQQTTDAEFVEYLSGGNDANLLSSSLPSSSQTDDKILATPPANKTKSSPPPPLPPSLDEWHHLNRDDHPALALTRPMRDLNETFRRLVRTQQSNVEKSRARTSANVRRALYGNLFICVAKFSAWLSSGSSAMLSEFIHSVVDCGNQSLLLVGLRDSENVADRKHPYGYGKSVYFWALVSALGTFFLGAGVSMTHAVGDLIEPSLNVVNWQVWGVLGLSFVVDGYVLSKTISELHGTMPKGTTFWNHLKTIRDPATLAILLEDGAACLGIVIAIAGISATHMSGMPVFDGMAGVGISALLAAVGLVLVRVNHKFLLGQGVESDITKGIESIILRRRSVEHVHSVQSQWTGPETFSYKAEVDFDGTFLAAKLMPRYQKEFLEAQDTLGSDLRVLLSWYAEDVMRTVEREVRHIEAEIRKVYPAAEYIELEPMSKNSDRFAIDDGIEAQLKRIEMEALNRFLMSMYQTDSNDKGGKEKGPNKPLLENDDNESAQLDLNTKDVVTFHKSSETDKKE